MIKIGLASFSAGKIEAKKQENMVVGLGRLRPIRCHPLAQTGKYPRVHVLTMKEQVVKRNHSDDLEKDLAGIKQGIANLYKLAEVADPTDEGMAGYHADYCVTMYNEKVLSSVQTRLPGFSAMYHYTKFGMASVTALDRFEAWAATVRPFLDNPDYKISNQDKISAMLILGVKGTVWPTEGYPGRIKFTLTPPDIAHFCEDDFVRLSHGTTSLGATFPASCL